MNNFLIKKANNVNLLPIYIIIMNDFAMEFYKKQINREKKI